MNASGDPVDNTTDPREITAMLVRQLTHPVRWMDCVKNMVSDGAQEFSVPWPGVLCVCVSMCYTSCCRSCLLCHVCGSCVGGDEGRFAG